MALVTITYNAWDHNREVVPAAQMPEVWFRPLKTSLASGLMTDRNVKGTLNTSTGAGQVQLESQPGLVYVPFMRWLIDPSEPDAHGYCEWDAFYPAEGGPIDELPDVAPRFGQFYYGLGDPPVFLRSRNDVIYIDISGSGGGYWQPWVPSGSVVEV